MSKRNFFLGILATCLTPFGVIIGMYLFKILQTVVGPFMPEGLFGLGGEGLISLDFFDGTYLINFAGGAICGLGIVLIFQHFIKKDYPKSFYMPASFLPAAALLATIVLPFFGEPMHWKYLIQEVIIIICLVSYTNWVAEEVY